LLDRTLPKKGAISGVHVRLCVRRVRFVIVSPDPRQLRRCQAGNPLIGLSESPEPPFIMSIGLREWALINGIWHHSTTDDDIRELV
jgi:hypothetical protein